LPDAARFRAELFSERFSIAQFAIESTGAAGISRGRSFSRSFAVKGNQQIIAELNKLLKNELTAINQYFLHARMMKHWGFERLGKKIYEESIGEMKHADKLIQRILLLDGLPNLQDLGKLAVGETVPECLAADLKLETAARTALVAAVAHCETAKDFVSREIVVDILEDAEEHIDSLETELDLLEKVGEQNYLQSQIGEGKDPS
jgi:bacterioferritin